MTCQEVQGCILGPPDGGNDDAQLAEAFRHLEGCETCRAWESQAAAGFMQMSAAAPSMFVGIVQFMHKRSRRVRGDRALLREARAIVQSLREGRMPPHADMTPQYLSITGFPRAVTDHLASAWRGGDPDAIAHALDVWEQEIGTT